MKKIPTLFKRNPAGMRLWKRFVADVGKAGRAHDNWPMFRLGYITALEDVERTGLRPWRDDAKVKSAEAAFARYVERGPGSA